MNYFKLDYDIALNAKYHCDKHVVKMCTEYAQLLSTAHRVLDGTPYYATTQSGRRIQRYKHDNEMLYKATHVNHPTAQWVRRSVHNYNELFTLWTNLLSEYTVRYNKIHKCAQLIEHVRTPPSNIGNDPYTQPPQAMPDDCKHKDVVQAYREYYHKYKNHIANWITGAPKWYQYN